MKKRFDELGIENAITRTTDKTIDADQRVDLILDAFGNTNDVIVVSNHINAGGGDGAEVIYALRNNNTLSDMIGKELENTGQNFRKSYQRRLPSNTSKDYYFIHRNTPNTEAIIVEYGFLDSTDDDVTQIKINWEEYAESVVKAITNYIGATYIPIGDNLYTVIKGDSLWSIARKYNVTVDELKTSNNLKSNLLSIGQILIIPSKEDENENDYIVYNVVSGDNLYKIAKKYNKTVTELIEYNKLKSTLLSIGQKLLIPNTNSIKTYIVKSGDTLYGIAKKYNVTVDYLKSNLLSIGQILKI